MNRKLSTIIIAVIILPFLVGFSPASYHSETYDQWINWMSFGEALKYSRDVNRIIFVYVYTDWCPQCKKLDAMTFTDETVQYYLRNNFVCTKINAESDREHQCNGQTITERQIAQSLGVDGYPTMIMLAPLGGSLGAFSGFRESADLQQILIYYGEGHFLKMPYDKWLKNR